MNCFTYFKQYAHCIVVILERVTNELALSESSVLLLHFCSIEYSFICRPKVLMLLISLQIRYEKYHVCYGGDQEDRKANYTDMVRFLILSLLVSMLQYFTTFFNAFNNFILIHDLKSLILERFGCFDDLKHHWLLESDIDGYRSNKTTSCCICVHSISLVLLLIFDIQYKSFHLLC